jgi:type 1 fimbria pilin
MMRKTIRLFCLTFFVLLAWGQRAFAECAPGGINHGTMMADVVLDAPGNAKAGDYIGSIPFYREYNVTTPVGDCEDGTEILLYAFSSPDGRKAKFFRNIDGRETFYIHLGDAHYAYAIEWDGYAFSQSGTKKPHSGLLNTPTGSVMHIYAAVDNPKPYRQWQGGDNATYLGAIRLTPTNQQRGFSFRGKFDIKSIASCEVTNQDLHINLDPIAIDNFPTIGLARQSKQAQDSLNIQCSGDMTATIRINGLYGSTSHQGKNAVFKTKGEGQGSNAAGFGFVLSSPNYVEGYFSDNEAVSLGKITSNGASIPIQAEYFRYGENIRAGEMESAASFVIQFN